jgi:hypothetical protein
MDSRLRGNDVHGDVSGEVVDALRLVWELEAVDMEFPKSMRTGFVGAATCASLLLLCRGIAMGQDDTTMPPLQTCRPVACHDQLTIRIHPPVERGSNWVPDVLLDIDGVKIRCVHDAKNGPSSPAACTGNAALQREDVRVCPRVGRCRSTGEQDLVLYIPGMPKDVRVSVGNGDHLSKLFHPEYVDVGKREGYCPPYCHLAEAEWDLR